MREGRKGEREEGREGGREGEREGRREGGRNRRNEHITGWTVYMLFQSTFQESNNGLIGNTEVVCCI